MSPNSKVFINLENAEDTKIDLERLHVRKQAIIST